MFWNKDKKAGRDDRQQIFRILFVCKKVFLQIFQKLRILFSVTLLFDVIPWHTAEFLLKEF